MARVAMIVWNEFVHDARVLKEAQTLVGAGHQVTVHAIRKPGSLVDREEFRSGIRVIRVKRDAPWLWPRSELNSKKSSESFLITEARRIASRLRWPYSLVARVIAHSRLSLSVFRGRPDVIHAHDVNVLPTAWLGAKLLRIPLVYDAHEISTDREGYKPFRRWVGMTERFIMARVAASITTTNMRAKFFSRAYNISRPLVLQNVPRYTVAKGSNILRKELNLVEQWPIVLYQGGLQQGRGIDCLLRAVANVRHAYLVLIGDGAEKENLHKIVCDLAIQDRVTFVPTVSLDMLPIYTASADIGVQPILNTCLNHLTTDSNKLFEYIMAGLPVIASDLPEIAKIVIEHEVGELVPSGDVIALSSALTALVHDVNLRNFYGVKSREAAQTLNWENQEHILVECYERVVADADVPA